MGHELVFNSPYVVWKYKVAFVIEIIIFREKKE